MHALWGLAVSALGVLIMLDAEGLITHASKTWVSVTEPVRQRVRTSPWARAVAANRDDAFERAMLAWRVSGLLLVAAGAGIALTSLHGG